MTSRTFAVFIRPGSSGLLRIALVCLVLAASLSKPLVPAWAQSLAAEQEAVAGRIRTETIRELTLALTADDMEGRGTGQPGGLKAAQYLADRFARLGLKPLGEGGTFLQPIAFQAIGVRPDSSLRIGDDRLEWAIDFVYRRPTSAAGETIEAQGELVCVDPAAVSGKPGAGPHVDLKGKIAVLVDGGPAVIQLASQGIAGAVVALDSPSVPPHLTDRSAHHQVTLARPLAGMSGPLPPVAYVTRKGADRLFARSPQSLADTLAKARAGQPFGCKLGQTAKMSLRLDVESRNSPNVLGWLEGCDRALKGEAVVYSAHYDAYGKDPEGRIRPGAADNALGVAKMFAVAEALVHSPRRPRRSVIFLAPAAEELGLLGSRYWLEHPTWPVARLAANLNFDGIDTETYGPLRAVVVEGLGHSELDGIAVGVARELGLLPVPDLNVKQRVFFRSDHYEFALRGVPVIYVFGLGVAPRPTDAKAASGGLWGAIAGLRSEVAGLAEVQRRADDFLAHRYHQPSDIVRPEWDWQGVHTAAVFYLLAGLRVANSEKMPAWLPASEYNRPRGARPAVRGG